MRLCRNVVGLVAAAAIAVSAALLTIGWDARPAAAETPPVYLVKGVAVGGYDPVAYFTEKKPVKGNPAIALEHEGAKYFFASEEHRELFKKEPNKYLPQYGGYCAWAVSQGSTAKIDPTAWTVHDGRLFLNYNKSVKGSWDKNLAQHIAKADANWPKIVGVEKATVRVTPPAAEKEKDAVKEAAKDASPEAAKAAVKDGDAGRDAAKDASPDAVKAAVKTDDAAKSATPDTAKAATEATEAKDGGVKDAAKEPAKDAAKETDKDKDKN